MKVYDDQGVETLVRNDVHGAGAIAGERAAEVSADPLDAGREGLSDGVDFAVFGDEADVRVLREGGGLFR